MSEDSSALVAAPGAVLVEFVDYLMPLLTPYETTIYLYLLRKSDGSGRVRVGKRTIGVAIGRAQEPHKATISRYDVLKSLETKGCLQVRDTTREGTLYLIQAPLDVPSVRRILEARNQGNIELDWYRDPLLRAKVFERDDSRCRYCGEVVDEGNSTLDHLMPVALGGLNNLENLAVACLLCNSIKSGRSYEDAAGDLLASIRGRIVRKAAADDQRR